MQEQNLGNGVWVKTHFYREGHMLNSVTYCCVAGDPEILRFSVDLRPIAAAVEKYHQRLHEKARSNPDKHAAEESVSGGFFSSLAAPFKGIGHAATSLAKSALVKTITKSVSNVAKKAVAIPIAATGVHFVQHVLQGENVSHAAIGDLKNKIQSATEAAPYVAAVMSVLPGIGTGAAAAIGASAALAEGKPITEAMIAGARAAVPGGAIAQMAFDTGAALARGKSLTVAAAEAARNQLPTAARAAFDVGLAMAHGQSIQKSLATGVHTLAPAALHGLENLSQPALAAFATAHNAFDVIEKGQAAVKAVQNVKNAADLVHKANVALKELGPDKAQKALAAAPALATKIQNALAVKKMGAALTPAAVAEAKANADKALAALKLIHETAIHEPDPAKRAAAQKSVAILDVVAKQRGTVRAVAQANAGGVPGIQIDSQGRLIRGKFVRGNGPSDSYLYAKQGGGHGNWSRVSTDVSPDKRLPLPAAHAAAASTHAAMAAAHHEESKNAPPKKAAVHRQAAAAHAKKALAHNEAAKVSGLSLTRPGLIGCGCSVSGTVGAGHGGGHGGAGHGGGRGRRGGPGPIFMYGGPYVDPYWFDDNGGPILHVKRT